eukprot:811520-Lingulodinium_polyedra.AAC.1
MRRENQQDRRTRPTSDLIPAKEILARSSQPQTLRQTRAQPRSLSPKESLNAQQKTFAPAAWTRNIRKRHPSD